MFHRSCFWRDWSTRKVRLYKFSSCKCKVFISFVVFITRNRKRNTYLFLPVIAMTPAGKSWKNVCSLRLFFSEIFDQRKVMQLKRLDMKILLGNVCWIISGIIWSKLEEKGNNYSSKFFWQWNDWWLRKVLLVIKSRKDKEAVYWKYGREGEYFLENRQL